MFGMFLKHRKGLANKLHRYKVRYIARSGHTDKVTVWANSKGEARRIASERGCEDILKVRRVGISLMPLVVVLLILSLIVYLVVN